MNTLFLPSLCSCAWGKSSRIFCSKRVLLITLSMLRVLIRCSYNWWDRKFKTKYPLRTFINAKFYIRKQFNQSPCLYLTLFQALTTYLTQLKLICNNYTMLSSIPMILSFKSYKFITFNSGHQLCLQYICSHLSQSFVRLTRFKFMQL